VVHAVDGAIRDGGREPLAQGLVVVKVADTACELCEFTDVQVA
jgi:hypothetical protein